MQQNYVDALMRVMLKAKPMLDEVENIKRSLGQYVNINENIFFNDAKEFDKRYATLENKFKYTSDLGAWIDVSRLLLTLNNYGLSESIRYVEKHE